METTSNGEITGYTHHEIKEVGPDIGDVSTTFYRRLIEVINGKEVVYRVPPIATEKDGVYRFYTRIHIKGR